MSFPILQKRSPETLALSIQVQSLESRVLEPTLPAGPHKGVKGGSSKKSGEQLVPSSTKIRLPTPCSCSGLSAQAHPLCISVCSSVGSSKNCCEDCVKDIYRAQQVPDLVSVHCMHECSVTQSCLTLCGPMDCSLPGPSVHGIFQARILEQVTMSFSRESSRPRD